MDYYAQFLASGLGQSLLVRILGGANRKRRTTLSRAIRIVKVWDEPDLAHFRTKTRELI